MSLHIRDSFIALLGSVNLTDNFFYFIFYLQLYEKLAETLTRWGMFLENKLIVMHQVIDWLKLTFFFS